MPALDTDDVPSCSLWPFRRRRSRSRRCGGGWAPLEDEGSYRDRDEKCAPEPVSPALPAYVAAYGSAPPPPLPPRTRCREHLHPTTPVGHPAALVGVTAAAHAPAPPDPYATLLPLQPGHTGRSYASSLSHTSDRTTHTTHTTHTTYTTRTAQTSTSEYMSLDADPFDDPESPARIAYLNARLASLAHYTSAAPVEPPALIESPVSLLDIQDPKARAPVRVAASLGDKKIQSLGREERRLERARAEADAWRHEANLVYHQLCAARILALERMYERNAWRERCEAVEAEREGR